MMAITTSKLIKVKAKLLHGVNAPCAFVNAAMGIAAPDDVLGIRFS